MEWHHPFVTVCDCMSWSDFPGELEILVLGGFQILEICGLSSIADSIKYDKWIQSIQILQNALIDGMELTEKVRASNVDLIDSLIGDVLNDDNIELIPKYIQKLFKNIIQKTKCVQITINYCMVSNY